jgi:hypothetical protein
MTAARRLASSNGLRGHSYTTLIGPAHDNGASSRRSAEARASGRRSRARDACSSGTRSSASLGGSHSMSRPGPLWSALPSDSRCAVHILRRTRS